ncbi:hypothetical protein [Clostridium oceanicum]|uniref:Phage protein n=1 Tax=Clostridium oceanicum TaxID=1543 RepID=A0ABP3ULG3_9CLOT
MIDIDMINDKPIEIKLKGEVVKVKQPTFYLAKKVRSYEKNIDDLSEDEIYKKQSNILIDFLNNNTTNKKFNDKDIDNISFNSIKALYKELIKAILGAEEDPK